MQPKTAEQLIQASGWSTTDITKLPDTSFAFVASDGSRHLPYRNESGEAYLPLVRNALASLDNENAIPADKKADVKSTLQNSLRNTQASATSDVGFSSVSVLEADSAGQLPQEIMLLRAGNFNTEKYGVVPIESSDLHEMKANFDKGIGMAGSGETGIPVDYGHKSGENAGAWLKELAVKGDALYATKVEYSGSGRRALVDKEYKMISADFYPKSFGEWVDAESGVRAQNVIVGAGFTNRPMFTGNKPVMASETDDNPAGGKSTKTIIYINATQKKENENMNIDEVRVKAADDVTGAEQRFLQAHVADLSTAEVEKFELVATAADDKKPKEIKASEVTGTEGVVLVQASELKTVLDEVGSLKASYQASDREVIKGKVMEHVKRGALKADRLDGWTDRILASDTDGRKEMLADLDAMAANPLLAKEQGSGDGEEGSGSDPRLELTNKAKELVAAAKKEGKELSLKAAMDEARSADPELATRAADQGKERLSNMQASDKQLEAAGVNRG